jgi:ureidoglycolate lyase
MDIDLGDVAHMPTTGVRRMHESRSSRPPMPALKAMAALSRRRPRFRSRSCAGRRKVDRNSGDQGGVTEGVFEFAWRGETLYARNNAVGDSYLFGWSNWPEEAAAGGLCKPRDRALSWRANYHPDGGQMFYPLHGESFVVPLALPGDDVTPEQFVSFWCDGTCGLYLHPNIWHGAVVPLAGTAQLLDRQGRVHPRVSVGFPEEFGCCLAIPLRRP